MPIPPTRGPVAPAGKAAASTEPNAPKALVGEPYKHGPYEVLIYDAEQYVQSRFNLPPTGNVRVFHHAEDTWGQAPGERTWISTKHSGGMYGIGFYTALEPDRMFGTNQLQLEIPVSAFKGKKIVEFRTGRPFPSDSFVMPPGVDILGVTGAYGIKDQVWLVFKAGSDEWLNKSATQADFDGPGQTDGWD